MKGISKNDARQALNVVKALHTISPSTATVVSGAALALAMQARLAKVPTAKVHALIDEAFATADEVMGDPAATVTNMLNKIKTNPKKRR